MKAYLTNIFYGRAIAQTNDIQYWRVRILNAVLIAGAIFGGAAFAVNLGPAIHEGSAMLVLAYTLVYGWALTITIFQRFPYWMRAGTFLALLYLAGLLSATQYASAGDVRVWWLGLGILTAVFFGARAGVAVSIFNTLSLLTLGWLMSEFIIAAPTLDSYLDATDLFPWVSTSVTFFLISVLAVVSFGVVINGLRVNLQKATSLTSELEQDRVQLQQRTAELERREVQIRTAAEISRAISAELDPNKIFEQVVNLVKERFGLYYVGVFMLDESQQFAILRVGSGEAGRQMVADGHKLVIGGTSMIGWAISNRQARIALDVGEDAVHFQNPYLPSTRSELALPMISEDNVLGALTVQSIRQEAFDQDDITVLQGIADSLATAISNASLFNQVQENLDEIRTLHRHYLARAWEDVVSREGEVNVNIENRHAERPRSEQPPSLIEIPLILRDQAIGSITIERPQGPLSTEDETFIEGIALQTALALENARLVQQTERGAQFNRSVADITSKVWSSTSIDTILRTALHELGQTLGASDGVIQLHVKDQE